MINRKNNPKRIRELKVLLLAADKAYYNYSNPSLTDAEYDALKDEYDILCPNDKWIGASVPEDSEWKKASHVIPMHSLNKVKLENEFIEWDDKIGDRFYVVSEKCDGSSIGLQYDNGNLDDGITRGDGKIGESILQNVIKMQNVRRKIPGFTGSLRGEIVLFADDFEAVNEILKKRGKKQLENPRNAANGIAKRLNGEFSEFLTVLYYDITGDFKTEEEKFLYIENELHLKACFWKKGTMQEVIAVYNEYVASKREIILYDIDGLVIAANNIELQKRHGNKGLNPKAKIAWKFPSIRKTAKVINVTWESGKNRRITPLIHIEPTRIGGITARKMTGHNINFFRKLGLYKGCTLLFERANDILPMPIKVI